MKTKIVGKLGKRGMIVLAVLIAVSMIASAGLLTYFGRITTTATVTQGVMVDENNWNVPVTAEFDAQAGCCYCFEHEITNYGCDPIWLDWETSGLPDMDGITVSFTRSPYLGELELEVLDGFALYDDFVVYVDDILVYTYDAMGNGDENWIIHIVDLLPFEINALGTHTVKVDCTSEMWEYFETYGQLGVNYIQLTCELGTLTDYVDIGDETSEAGHNLVGWGCIEPATHGGTWGGIDDCRATWVLDDESYATVDLTLELECEECGDCIGIPIMEDAFELCPDETIQFLICYDFDMLIIPDTYIITTELVPATEPAIPTPPAPPS